MSIFFFTTFIHNTKKCLSAMYFYGFFSKAFERCFWFWKPIFEQTGGDILEGRISTQFCTVFLERMRWEDKHTVGKNVLKKVSFFVFKKTEPKKKKKFEKMRLFWRIFKHCTIHTFFNDMRVNGVENIFKKGCWTTKKNLFWRVQNLRNFQSLREFLPFYTPTMKFSSK